MPPHFGHFECCPRQGAQAAFQRWQMLLQLCARQALERASLDAKAERQPRLDGVSGLYHVTNLPQLT